MGKRMEPASTMAHYVPCTWITYPNQSGYINWMNTQCILLDASGQMSLQIKPELECGSRRQHNSTFAFLLQDQINSQENKRHQRCRSTQRLTPTLNRSRRGRIHRTDTQREQEEREQTTGLLREHMEDHLTFQKNANANWGHLRQSQHH